VSSSTAPSARYSFGFDASEGVWAARQARQAAEREGPCGDVGSVAPDHEWIIRGF
jgi:hypothetical protein